MLKRRQTKKSDRKYWIDRLDEVFSLYIRMRDSRDWHFRAFRCISCGDVKPFDQMDCGHFIGRACMKLRWEPVNAHGECRKCNRLTSSHLLYYRKNLIIKLGTDAIQGSAIAQALEPKKKLALIQKIGKKRVEELEEQKFESKKWSVEELQEQYMYFAALVLEMKKEM